MIKDASISDINLEEGFVEPKKGGSPELLDKVKSLMLSFSVMFINYKYVDYSYVSLRASKVIGSVVAANNVVLGISSFLTLLPTICASISFIVVSSLIFFNKENDFFKNVHKNCLKLALLITFILSIFMISLGFIVPGGLLCILICLIKLIEANFNTIKSTIIACFCVITATFFAKKITDKVTDKIVGSVETATSGSFGAVVEGIGGMFAGAAKKVACSVKNKVQNHPLQCAGLVVGAGAVGCAVVDPEFRKSVAGTVSKIFGSSDDVKPGDDEDVLKNQSFEMKKFEDEDEDKFTIDLVKESVDAFQHDDLFF